MVALREAMARGADVDKSYALIIGISEYKDPGIRRLNYTHADAEGVFNLLTDPKSLGLPKNNVRILLDEDATRFNIKNTISSWLFRNADKDSSVFIFFAGHGGVEEDRLGIEKDNLAKYMLPYDTVLDDLYSSAISNRDFNELLLTIRSKKLVIFMDSCYSGGVSEKPRNVKIVDDPYQKLAEGEGRIVIAASQPDQFSYEDSNLKHGVFTYNLLEALSGKADWDNDGYVTVLDAYKYLQDAVPRDAMKLAGGKQEPILRGDITKDFVISIDRERFENIEKEEIIQRKISKLLELRNQDNLSGKQYARLREIVKTDYEKLSDKDKQIAKLFNDFLSGDITLTAFIEDSGIIEPELLPEKKNQELERLQKQKKDEEERIHKEKEREERKRIEDEKEQLKVQLKEKGSSYNRILVAASVMGVFLLGYWMIAPSLNDSSKIPDTKLSLPSAVATTASPAPTVTSIPDKKTFINSIGMEFVQIPEGEFDMGSPSTEVGRIDDEGPVHHVKISKAFYLGKYEVTQKQWRDVMGTDPSSFKGDDLPVERVSWDDVKEFIKKLNEKEGTTRYRLPSEAKWEYAARAGTISRYSFGDDESKLGDFAWYDGNSNGRTHPVGQKKPNTWGLYDMHGNVWEWLQDSWHENYNGAPTDGSSWESGNVAARVVRGGGWGNLAGGSRSAFRFFDEPGDRFRILGFRLLRDL